MADIRTETQKLFHDTFTGLDPLQLQDLEIGIYNSTIEYCGSNGIPLTWSSQMFCDAYLAKARSMYCNLKTDTYVKNTTLIERMKEKEFLPHELPFKTRDTVHPEAWRYIIDREMMINKGAYETSAVAMSDQITCGKCKKKKVSYYETQSRSADEPMTIHMSCLICGHRWKH
jgi:transcription elongation factor S-II